MFAQYLITSAFRKYDNALVGFAAKASVVEMTLEGGPCCTRTVAGFAIESR